VSFPLAVLFLYQEGSPVKVGFAVVLCLMVVYTHRANIVRLCKGTENRLQINGQRAGQP
jgi:glycerol-3-phosphate acyltransferase PlsY